jgi:hypothetical protein
MDSWANAALARARRIREAIRVFNNGLVVSVITRLTQVAQISYSSLRRCRQLQKVSRAMVLDLEA